MKRIRIAVGSNDGERINPGHLGMAKDFYIFDIFRNGSSSFVEKRRNTSPPEIVKHGDPRKMRGGPTTMLWLRCHYWEKVKSQLHKGK
jgi:hypothetical protein